LLQRSAPADGRGYPAPAFPLRKGGVEQSLDVQDLGHIAMCLGLECAAQQLTRFGRQLGLPGFDPLCPSETSASTESTATATGVPARTIARSVRCSSLS
jgi:hypothetical protein